jgi:hypothetical protein
MLFYILLLIYIYMLCSMISRADANEEYADFARPGGWNGIFLSMLFENEAFFPIALVNLIKKFYCLKW